MTASKSLPLSWLTARPIAHRGLHDRSRGIVENSRSAFAAAIDHGYAIECDVQVSTDGEAVIFHDVALERLTEQSGKVKDLRADDLTQIVLKDSNDQPQTLEQLLAQVNGRVPLVIELKSLWDRSTRLTQRACEIVASYHGQAALMSFDPLIVETIRRSATTIPCGGVAGLFQSKEWLELSAEHINSLKRGDAMCRADPHFMSYSVDVLATPAAKRFRATGKPVICWTVRDEATAARALKLSDQITFERFLA